MPDCAAACVGLALSAISDFGSAESSAASLNYFKTQRPHATIAMADKSTRPHAGTRGYRCASTLLYFVFRLNVDASPAIARFNIEPIAVSLLAVSEN
jgi:hypothetical protein